jgi:hypothetical protein
VGISCRNVELADADVGHTGHVKSASLDSVVCEREFSEALDARAQVAAKALEAVAGSLSFRLGRR